ncbi:hypothetical protein O1611_g5978 [Lasiodiplodia mahajangana]|uniref:Uncharacterized protein n=1 Tax=Lasiodiplodia mahajangana TaxID=1108764 RepID=A0ACC2JK06_9PEZI|nr:hypothetical protein O1611_g5978 [Lasiodiplodia mahajangana]
MDIFDPTRPPDEGARPPDDTSSHQERLEHHELRGPLNALASPIFALVQQARELKQNRIVNAENLASQPYAIANFLVVGEPSAVKGVIKAVYQDLKDGNKDARIEYHETKAPYIRIEAPSEEDVLVLLRTAQRLAAAYLSGCSVEPKAIFVEPPISLTSDFKISVDAVNATERVRPTIETLVDRPPIAPEPSLDKYRDDFSGNLHNAFEKVSSLCASLAIRVHLGQYFLQTYRQGKFTVEEFEAMVKNPRATGELDTCLAGAVTGEELNIEAAMRLIQAANSPCLPMDNQTPTPGQVHPSYVLECWHDNNRYETELDIYRGKKGGGNEPTRLIFARTKLVPQSAQAPKFEVISISLGRQAISARKLDLRVVATAGDENLRASEPVKKYFEMGQAVLQGSRDDFRCYPVVHLPENHAHTNKFKSVALKSIYRFSWKRTGYVVQFTVNRRWESIRQMNRKAQPDTDFDIVIYADNWDQDSRTQPGGTVSKIWGEDLRGLLRDEDGDATGSALSRVQGLIKRILEIRDFFEGPKPQITV